MWSGQQKHAAFLCLVVSLFGFSELGAGRDLYVSNLGHDVPDCGLNNNTPCATIRYTISLSQAKDAIYVDGSSGLFQKEGNTSHIPISHTLTLKSMKSPIRIQCQENQTKLFNISGSEGSVPTVNIHDFSIEQCIRPRELLSSVIVASNAKINLFDCQFTNNGMIIYHSQLEQDCQSLQVYITNSTFVSNLVSRPFFHPAITLAGCQSLRLELNNTTLKTSPVRLVGEQNLTVLFHNVTVDGFQQRGAGIDISMANNANEVVLSNCTVMNHDHGRESPVLIGSSVQPAQTPTVHLTDVSFVNNYYTKTSGGALALVARLPNRPLYMNVQLKQCLFFNNSAKYDGGAIYIENVSKVQINNCSFSQNNGSKGGAVKVYRGRSITVINSEMVHNHAFHLLSFDYLTMGGAMYVDGAQLFIRNSTFKYNVARYGATEIFVQNSPSVQISQSYFENDFSGLAGLQTGLLNIRNLEEDWQKDVAVDLSNNTFNATAERDHTLMDIQAMSSVQGNNLWCRTGQNIQLSKIPGLFGTPVMYKHVVFWCETCPGGTCTHINGHLVDDDMGDPLDPSNSSFSNTCQPCPEHATCAYGQVYADPNYWGYKEDSRLKLQVCPRGYCCQDTCRGYNICATARTGRLCSKCKEGYVPEAGTGECIRQDRCLTPGVPWTLVLVFAFAFLYLGMMLINNRMGHWIYLVVQAFRTQGTVGQPQEGIGQPPDLDVPMLDSDPENSSTNQGGLLDDDLLVPNQTDEAQRKVITDISVLTVTFFVFVQLAPLIYGFRTPIDHPVVQAITDVAYLRPPFTLFGSMCSFKSLGGTGVILMNLIAVAALYVLLGVTCLVSHAVVWISTLRNMPDRKQRQHKLTSCFTLAYVLIQLVAYVPLVSALCHLIQCVPLGDMVMYMDASQTCYQWWHYIVIAYLVLCVAQLSLAIGFGGQSLYSSKVSLRHFVVGCLVPPVLWIYVVAHNIRKYFRTDTNQPHPLHPYDGPTKSAVFLLQDPFKEDGTRDASLAASLWPKIRRNWYSVIVLQSLALVLLSVLLAHNPVLKSFLVLLLCLLISIIHNFAQPYVAKGHNRHETLLTVLQTLFAIMGFHRSIVYSTGKKPLGTSGGLVEFYGYFYAVVLIIAAVVMLSCFLTALSGAGLKRWRRPRGN